MTRQHVEGRRGVRHRAGENAAGAETLHLHDGIGDQAAGGFEADEAGARCGDPYRPAAVLGVGDGRHPGGDGGARSARRPAGRAIRVPRVARDAQGLALGERQAAELGGGGLAEKNEARVHEPSHHRIRCLDGCLPGAAGPMGGGPSGNVGKVLDGQRYAVERRELFDGHGPHHGIGRGGRGFADVVVGPVAKGVQPGVEPVHPLEKAVGQLDRAHLLLADGRGEFDGGCERVDR